MELIMKYSGISAILLYLLLLYIVLKFSRKKVKEEKKTIADNTSQNNEVSKLDLNDEDALIASLIASIDYREETKKDIRIISIKEV